MEKKTIGKFISVLRKANGMTQRELAEKLFVSDKTVSRWECDECAPDLALIPTIAEIFGITADELLRGERNSLTVNGEPDSIKQKAKSDKRFKTMLHNRLTKHKNMTLVSVGLIALALISAMVFNLGLLKGVVGFCVALVFLVAAVICQIFFATSCTMSVDEEDTYCDNVKKANSDIAIIALKVIWATIVVFAFVLPLALLCNAYIGLTIGSWVTLGGTFSLIAFVLSYIVYVFVVRKILINKHILHPGDKEREVYNYQKRLLLKILSISICLALVLISGVVVMENMSATKFAHKYEFSDYDDWAKFKEFMKDGKAYLESESGFFVDAYEEPVYDADDEDKEYKYKVGYLYDSSGNESVSYEYRERFYSRIEYLEFNKDGTPHRVAIYTNKAIADAHRIMVSIETFIYVCLVVEVVASALIYIMKIKRISNCKR